MEEIETNRRLDAFRCCQINWLLVVPSSGLNEVYDYYQKQDRCVYATREEESVAIATGLTLAGERPLILIQQSGVGNALNAVFTLPDAYHVFFPILVCMRPEQDPNPVQRVSIKNTMLILEELGCSKINWDHSGAVEQFKIFLKEQSRWIVCPH
jgi:sulfopyruvate decarboxylase TPP-binding subunit